MRSFTKITLMIALAIMTTIGAYAQTWDYTESFENHNAVAGSYTNNSFVGDNGITWTYSQGRADNGYKVNPANNSLMFATKTGSNAPLITSSVISGGIKNFSVKLIKAFTGAGNRQVALYINGTFVANSIAWDNTNVQTLSVNNLDIIGNVVIEIRNIGAQVSIDDLSWTKFGAGNGGIPSKLRVSVLKPAVPMSNIPFRALVELVDNNGLYQTIPSPTKVDFKIFDNTANLLQQQTIFIPANTAVFYIDNLMLNYVGNIIIKAEAPENKNPAGYYLDDASSSFTVSSTPILNIDIYDKGHAGAMHPVITVTARNAQGNPNQYYNGFTGSLSITGGGFTGTTTASFSNGIATFSDIVFTSPNANYSVSANAQYLAASASKNVFVLPAPTMTEIIVPAYLKGEGSFLPDGNGRIPSYALVTFNNLHPNTEYRFITGGVETVPSTIPTTPGNVLAYNHNTNSYVMSSTKNLQDVGNYSSFMTGSSETSKTVWINMIPTTNAVFAVNKINYWAVDLGTEKGSTISRLYTTKTSKNLRFSTAANNFTTGLVSYASGLYDNASPSAPKNYIVVYDQNNAPISTAIVQSSGSVLATPGFDHQAPAFYANYESTNGAWATFIPNNLPGGIRKIVEYTPAGAVVNTWTDNDGTWADYNTISSNYGAFPPNGSTNEIAFAIPQFNLITPNTGAQVCNPLDQEVPVIWNSRGIGKVNIYVSQNLQPWETLALDFDARQGQYLWDIIRERYSFTNNRLRIQSVEFPYIDYISGTFNIFDAPEIGSHTTSNSWCPDEDIYLTVHATGSNLTYQWYKDGVKINDNADYRGTKSEILYIDNLKHRLSGTYHAEVMGHANCASVQTGLISVYVARPLSIFKPTATTKIGAKLGETATLEFTIHGNGGNGLDPNLPQYQYRIQWYKYDPNLPVDTPLKDAMPRIAGSNSNYLTINKFTKKDVGVYYAIIKGLCGEAVKTPYFEVEEIELSITKQPADLEVCLGKEATFTFEYFTNINETAKINWFKDNVQINDGAKYTGTTTNTLKVMNLTAADGGAFTAQVVLQESGTTTTTGSGILFILNPVTINSQTSGDLQFQVTKQLLLEVDAEGNDPSETLTYKWFKDGVEITGATENSYTKNNITNADAGVYKVEITGVCGTVTSENMNVEVVTGGSTDVSEVSKSGYTLSGATPNPVNSVFSLNVTSPESAKSEITVTDMTGRTLAVIFSGMLEEGTHNLLVDVNKIGLPTGTYFYTLRNAKVSLTQNFTVIK